MIRFSNIGCLCLGVFVLAGCCGPGPGTGTTTVDLPAIDRPEYQRVVTRSDAIDGITGTDPYGYSLATADRLEMLELLRGERFEDLDRILTSYQVAFEQDPFKEDRVIDAYRAFQVADPSLTTPLDSWVAGHEGSYCAHLARAMHYDALGWQSRGHAYRRETNEEQIDGMNEAFQQVRAELEAALAIEQDLALAYRLLLFVDTTGGERSDNKATLERAKAATADSYWVHSAYMMHLSPRWGGSHKQMQTFAEEVAPLAADNPRYRTFSGRVDRDKGLSHRIDDQFDQALLHYSLALTHGPDPDYFRGRGETFYRNGQYEEALLDMHSTLAIQPQDHEAMLWAARALARLDRVDEAQASIESARALDPTEPDYVDWAVHPAKQFVSEGYELYQAERFDDAIAEFEKGRTLDPTNHEAHYWHGRAQLKLGNNQAALEDFERAIAREPTHFDSYRNIDWILFQDRKLDEIIEHWEDFLALQPDHADAHLEVGGTYMHKVDMASAKEHFKRSCDLGNKEACSNLNRM